MDEIKLIYWIKHIVKDCFVVILVNDDDDGGYDSDVCCFQFVDGEPVYKACCRTNIGGFHVSDYLKQLLSLKYPHHM